MKRKIEIFSAGCPLPSPSLEPVHKHIKGLARFAPPSRSQRPARRGAKSANTHSPRALHPTCPAPGCGNG
jgi:hypothetical protein